MEDRQIVGLYFARTDQAIAETERKYGAYCRSIAKNVLQSDRDADECVSDVYLAAWNSIPPQRPQSLAAYVGKLTRRKAIDRLRARSSLKRGGGTVGGSMEELDECIPAADRVEDAVLRRELGEAVRGFVGRLGETERNVFLLRYWYVCPVAEIAQRLGFTQSKVKSMLLRTRKKLRAFLEKEALA